MSGREYTKFQKKVIDRYFENLDAIMLQKIQELVTELYLAETEAKAQRLWERVDKAMVKLKVKPGIHRHIMEKRDVKILALNVEEWVRKK